MATISVIVPVYNVEPYLHRCIDSILNQTFTDFELILVNDGSTDNSGKICDEYAKKDNRIKVIHQENSGQSFARNTGLDIAQGKYIMFCDSDDFVAEDWCEVMLNAAQTHPDAFIVSNLYKVNCGIKQSYLPENTDLSLSTYFEIYKSGISAYAVNKIYEAKKLTDLHIRFDETLKLAEDVKFNVIYYSTCNNCIYISSALYYYVDNFDSITHCYHPNHFDLLLHAFWCRLPLISQEDIPEYCDIWLYQFIHLFDNVFKPQCKMNYIKKLRYNHQMIQSKEFRFCLEHASGKNENPLFMKILRTHNYYLFHLFTYLTKLKQKLRRK